MPNSSAVIDDIRDNLSNYEAPNSSESNNDRRINYLIRWDSKEENKNIF